jgi:hypothetical protein
MSRFLLELCHRALDSAVAAMSTSYLALLAAGLFTVGSLLHQHWGEGWQGIRKNWGLARTLKYGVIFWCSWWVLLFGYHLFYKIPHEINQTANRTPPPPPKIFPISLPPPPFHRVQIPILPSFVLVSPGPLVNFDSWDFIIAHKGNDKVESIDVQFIDLDKLNSIRKTQTSAAPNEYSVFLHLDQLYPKGKGSLFAKQFIWRPFSLEHGHYTVNISTSTGRFYEELYIEKVADKWKYAAKVKDIDTKQVRLACRDKLFPVSVASDIKANQKCWPNMVQ